MSMSTEEKIRHYQRSIDRSLSNKPRLLHCIEMLGKLPVTVNHLQITGVGRTVNALRKIEEGVGESAKQLVTKWKVMVANHVDSSEDEDEACVPDVPECYESPDCDSEPENKSHQRGNVNQNQPEALRSVISISPPLVVDTPDEIPPSSSNSQKEEEEDNSDDEQEILPNKSSSSRHSSGSLENSLNKSKHSKKDTESKSVHKDKSSNSHSSHSKSSHNSEGSDHKKKNKNKSETSSPHKDRKHSDDRKRKYESNSSDRESDRKKKRISESEEDHDEEEENEEHVSLQEERSEEEVLEDEDEEEEDCKDTPKEKPKDKHHSSSSKHSKSKSHESRDKSKKDKKSSKSDGRGKDESSKSEERRSKESSKSKSCHSSSSSKDHSKDKDKDKNKDKDKDKHSKDKTKESSSKNHKDEKDRSSKKEIKDDRGKSKEQDKKDKERKESKHHKEHKEDKEHKDRKEHKEKKKTKITDGIDCNSGTSFADALGMCTIPPPKKKKESSSKESSSSSSKSNKDSLSLNSNSSSSSNTSISKSSSSKSLVKINSNPPDCPESLSLLSSNVKLEPLNRLDEEVDLAATLPEPSPYYKPLPHVNHAQRRQDEDELLSQVIYAKNQRTKVYSGVKMGNTTIPSLYDMCIRILIENIDALEYTGGVPYFIIKPVLERATADQLFMLEHHNPYLMEDSDSLWQFHCNKDFRTKKREEMESWREMYMRCLDEREAKLKALTANIKQSIDKSQPVRSTKLAYVDNIVKPPRNVLRKQARFGTANSNTSASDLKKKLITGVTGNGSTSSSSSSTSSSSSERISVPPPPIARSRQPSSSIVKKTKAPLMAKALQAIKGRYKR